MLEMKFGGVSKGNYSTSITSVKNQVTNRQMSYAHLPIAAPLRLWP